MGEAGCVSFPESRMVRGRLWRNADEADAGVGGWEKVGAPEVSHIVFLPSLKASTDSVSFLEVSLAAMMSSLPGLCFLSVDLARADEGSSCPGLEDAGALSVCDAGVLSSLWDLPFFPSCTVDTLLGSAAFNSVVAVSCDRDSFSVPVDFESGAGILGTTGLMAALLVVVLRWKRGGAGG